MAESALSIGEVAARAGTSVSAIRFYERNGLLPEAERVGGQRRFGEDSVRRLGFIRIAKLGGLSLEEVRSLLAAVDGGTPAGEQLQAVAARKLPEVDALIERVEETRVWLKMAAACECKSLDACGLFAG